MRLARVIVDRKPRLAELDENGSPIALLASEEQDPISILMSERAASNKTPIGDHTLVKEYLTPVEKPEKIICVGINYSDHAAEADASTEKPKHPSLFVRFANSLVGHKQPIICPSISHKYDFEGELAAIIGRKAWRVSREDAPDFVAGYSCLSENSVRDFQSHGRQVTPGKNFFASGSFGPAIVSRKAVGDLSSVALTTRLNGEVMQSASLSSMIFDVAELVSYISQFTVLEPGDVIATGTPSGVGALRDPQVWMKPGDTLEIELSKVGLLQNTVIAEAEWLKQTQGR